MINDIGAKILHYQHFKYLFVKQETNYPSKQPYGNKTNSI
jgi:hypothetical protein